MNSSDWDARYSSVEHPWGSAPAAALSARFAELPPGRAVDLGCGNGRHARWLGDAGWTVNAVDFSSVAIELARSGGEDRSIDYTVADGLGRLGRPARWIWWPSAFLHLPVDELVAVIAGAGSWLAPGGRLLYLGHALDNFTHGVGGPPDPSILPAIDDLARAASGLQVHELEHLVRPVGEGRAIDVLLHAQPWGAAAHRDLKSGTFT
ncbi:MAG: class I SAM-dependent methyltransferase [Rhodococcus qingshengii]